eukprot:SAG22_NODE_238_length_14184_cov_5.966844_2_plen_1420_part_00
MLGLGLCQALGRLSLAPPKQRPNMSIRRLASLVSAGTDSSGGPSPRLAPGETPRHKGIDKYDMSAGHGVFVSLPASKLRLLDECIGENEKLAASPRTAAGPGAAAEKAPPQAPPPWRREVWLLNLGGSRHLQWRRCEPVARVNITTDYAGATHGKLQASKLRVWEVDKARNTNYDLRTIVDVEAAAEDSDSLPVPLTWLSLVMAGPAVAVLTICHSCWTVLLPAIADMSQAAAAHRNSSSALLALATGSDPAGGAGGADGGGGGGIATAPARVAAFEAEAERLVAALLGLQEQCQADFDRRVDMDASLLELLLSRRLALLVLPPMLLSVCAKARDRIVGRRRRDQDYAGAGASAAGADDAGGQHALRTCGPLLAVLGGVGLLLALATDIQQPAVESGPSWSLGLFGALDLGQCYLSGVATDSADCTRMVANYGSGGGGGDEASLPTALWRQLIFAPVVLLLMYTVAECAIVCSSWPDAGLQFVYGGTWCCAAYAAYAMPVVFDLSHGGTEYTFADGVALLAVAPAEWLWWRWLRNGRPHRSGLTTSFPWPEPDTAGMSNLGPAKKAAAVIAESTLAGDSRLLTLRFPDAGWLAIQWTHVGGLVLTLVTAWWADGRTVGTCVGWLLAWLLARLLQSSTSFWVTYNCTGAGHGGGGGTAWARWLPRVWLATLLVAVAGLGQVLSRLLQLYASLEAAADLSDEASSLELLVSSQRLHGDLTGPEGERYLTALQAAAQALGRAKFGIKVHWSGTLGQDGRQRGSRISEDWQHLQARPLLSAALLLLLCIIVQMLFGWFGDGHKQERLRQKHWKDHQVTDDSYKDWGKLHRDEPGGTADSLGSLRSVASGGQGKVYSAVVGKQKVAIKFAHELAMTSSGSGSQRNQGTSKSNSHSQSNGLARRRGFLEEVRAKLHYHLFEAGSDTGVSRELMEEVQQLATMRHQNIVGFVGWVDTRKAPGIKETVGEQPLLLLTEWCDGGMLSHAIDPCRDENGAPYEAQRVRDSLRPRCPHAALSEGQMLGVARAVANGLAYLHRHSIVHLDLKPENVVFKRWQPHIPTHGGSVVLGPGQSAGRGDVVYGHAAHARPVPHAERWCSPDIKICDFGLKAAMLSGAEAEPATWDHKVPNASLTVEDRSWAVGTCGYMPPTITANAPHFADVFSFGILLYELASRRRIFTSTGGWMQDNANPRVLVQKKLDKRCGPGGRGMAEMLKMSLPGSTEANAPLRELICSCLNYTSHLARRQTLASLDEELWRPDIAAAWLVTSSTSVPALCATVCKHKPAHTGGCQGCKRLRGSLERRLSSESGTAGDLLQLVQALPVGAPLNLPCCECTKPDGSGLPDGLCHHEGHGNCGLLRKAHLQDMSEKLVKWYETGGEYEAHDTDGLESSQAYETRWSAGGVERGYGVRLPIEWSDDELVRAAD